MPEIFDITVFVVPTFLKERGRKYVFGVFFVPTFLKERGRKYVFGVLFAKIFAILKFDSKELKVTPNEKYGFSKIK